MHRNREQIESYLFISFIYLKFTCTFNGSTIIAVFKRRRMHKKVIKRLKIKKSNQIRTSNTRNGKRKLGSIFLKYKNTITNAKVK